MNQSNPIVLNSIPHEIHFNEIQKQVLVKLLNGQFDLRFFISCLYA